MDEIILLSLITLSLLTIFCLSKILDKRGLYFALVILELVSFVLTFKIGYVFKLNINVGLIPFLASLSVIYIFIIKYGYKETKNLLLVSLYSNISIALFLVILNYFVPAITETISINMQGTFEYNYKILIIYPFMMLLSQYIIIKLYKLVSTLQNNISINIILTYILTALLYTAVFYILCYLGVMTIKDSLFLGISSYILGLAIMIINTIFINYSVKGKKVTK